MRKAWRRVFGWLIARPSYVWGVAAFLALVVVAPDSDGSILHVTAPPLFLVTILELARNRRLHAAAFLRNHMAEFLVNDELQSAFYELIYNYSDEEWAMADSVFKEEAGKYAEQTNIPPDICSRVWEKLNPEEKWSVIGKRKYHPKSFQGSEEERRLDRVLHHFGLIAHYWSHGAIDIEDISGVAGYHFGVIGTREVTLYYINLGITKWDALPYRKAVGVEPPFKQLKQLLEDLEKWQKKRNA